jgi:exodeoxyribonuclease VII small subunit
MSEKQKNPFESKLARLEEIVRSMESGQLPLDESLKLFEEGVKISRECQSELDAAEQKVEILVNKSTGEKTAFKPQE